MQINLFWNQKIYALNQQKSYAQCGQYSTEKIGGKIYTYKILSTSLF